MNYFPDFSNCYSRPSQRPEDAQTESGRVAQHKAEANNIPPYSNVAGEREKVRGR